MDITKGSEHDHPEYGTEHHVFAKVKTFLSLRMTVDPCMSFFRQSIGTFALANSRRLRFENRALPCSVLTCRINFSCGSFNSFPTRHACNPEKSLCPMPQQSDHQSVENSQTNCHANPTHAANFQCTKLLLRCRQHISQTTNSLPISLHLQRHAE